MSLTRYLRRLRPEDATPSLDGSGETFTAFIRRVNPRFQFDAHTRRIIEALDAAAHGEVSDLVINVPPGTGKSEIGSRLMGAYFVHTRPRDTFGTASYGAQLAQEMTRDAREYYVEADGQLDPAQRAKTRWKTTVGGGMWGAGFGGAVRGFRYNWGNLDDPHKGIEDLDSDLKRERIYRWYDTVWLNRAQLYSERPIVRVLIMQRLADNDLTGWLLSRPDADRYTLLIADAIRDPEPFAFVPKGARVLSDSRAPGELLSPERLPLEKLDEQRQDEDSFLAQYQQRPRARTGRIFDRKDIQVISPEKVPLVMLQKVVGADPAVSTRQSADDTCVIALGYGIDGRYYFFRPLWEKIEAPDLRVRIPIYARQHRAQRVGVETVAFQLSLFQELQRDPTMAGIELVAADVDRDKEARARAWSWLVKNRLVHLVEDGSGWTDRALDQLAGFPRVKHDDLVDACGTAVSLIRQTQGFSAHGG